jgi:cytochrome c peroxidase
MHGKRLFNGKANCVACHWGPALSDGLVHDTGIGRNASFLPPSLALVPLTFLPDGDPGAGLVWGRDADTTAMRTPTLRGLSQTGPYFHDGRFKTLQEVVTFYNNGGDLEPTTRSGRSQFIRPLNLSATDQAALVQYLQSLSAGVSDGL